MKKALIVTNIITFLLLVFMTVYAQLKANQAAENAIIARENAKEAEIQRRAAVEQAGIARAFQQEVEDALKEERSNAEKLRELLEKCN